MTLRGQLVDLADYDVESKPVGKGAFGVVYRGVRRTDGEVVAVKFLQPLPESNQRTFVREVTVPSRLHHPAVLPFIGFRLPEDPTKGPVIVTKFITNGSLGDVQNKTWQRRPLPPGFSPIKKSIAFYGIAHALALVHKMGVIHRDLKPDNILLGENFRPFLADFGLSRVTKQKSDEDDDGANLEMTARIGTPLMMAPELLVNDATTEYTSKVDVYAWGVTVYMAMLQSGTELVFSDRTPLGSNATRFMQLVLRGKRFARPRVIPDNWWAIVQRCWAARPDERPDFVEICQEIGKPEYALEPDKADEYVAYIRELGPPGVEAAVEAAPEPPPAAAAAPAGKKFRFVRKG